MFNSTYMRPRQAECKGRWPKLWEQRSAKHLDKSTDLGPRMRSIWADSKLWVAAGTAVSIAEAQRF